jgi:RNA polymerase-binding transcription factor DksA
MPAEERNSPEEPRVLPAGWERPHWRALLEARWGERLQEVIELSLAYHRALDAAPDGLGGEPEVRRLLRRAVAARRRLADVEEALSRLAAGSFGCCEQCGAAIEPGLLGAVPEARYCSCCSARPGMARSAAPATGSRR